MGRGKIRMELIHNEKSRYATFQKRKKGLMKKTYELATLCGIDVCTIVYGPTSGDRPIEPETWPPSSDEVHRIIGMYKAKARVKQDGKRTLDLSDFFKDRKKKVENQIARAREDYAQAKSSTYHDCITQLSEMKARELLGCLDVKIEAVKSRIELLTKESQLKMEGAASCMMGCCHTESSQSHANSMQDLYELIQKNNSKKDYLGVTHQQHGYWHVPLQCPSHHHHHHHHPKSPDYMLPIDHLSPMMMPLDDNHDFSQFGGASTSDNILYTPYTTPLYDHHDPTAVMAPENVTFSNPTPLMSYYAEQMQQYVHCPMTSSFSPQLLSMPPFYGFNDPQTQSRNAEN